MKIFAIISEYGDCREVCFELVSQQTPVSRVTAYYDAIISRDTFAPLQSEAYLFESDLRFTVDLSVQGVELRVLPPFPAGSDQTDLYEAVTSVSFTKLREILQRYSKPIGSYMNLRRPSRSGSGAPQSA